MLILLLYSSGSGNQNANINAEDLEYSNNSYHNQDGSRPYQDSALTIQEIIDSGPPSADPRGSDGLYWKVDGGLMTATKDVMSYGIYELLISPDGTTIWHFLFDGK